MQRLTRKTAYGYGIWASKDYCLDMIEYCSKVGNCKNCIIAKLLDRLCEYEETDFEPKDIMKMYRIALLNANDLIDKIEDAVNIKL